MDSKQIIILLEKYWDGATTLAEERQLRDYFNQGEVAAELQTYQPLFQLFKAEQEAVISDDFMDRMTAKLSDNEAIETEKPAAKVRSLGFYLTRIAAAGLVLIVASFLIKPYFEATPNDMASNDIGVETPEEAYIELTKALALVSTNLDKGKVKAREGMLRVEKATKVIK